MNEDQGDSKRVYSDCVLVNNNARHWELEEDGHCFLDYETILSAALEIFSELKVKTPAVEACFQKAFKKVQNQALCIAVGRDYVDSREFDSDVRTSAGDSAGRDSDGETKEDSSEDLHKDEILEVEKVDVKKNERNPPPTKKKRKRKRKKKKKKKKAAKEPSIFSEQIEDTTYNLVDKTHVTVNDLPTIDDLPINLSTSLEVQQSSRKKIRQRTREKRRREVLHSKEKVATQESMIEYSTRAATGSLKRKIRTPIYDNANLTEQDFKDLWDEFELCDSDTDDDLEKAAIDYTRFKKGDQVLFNGTEYTILEIHWADGTAVINREEAVTYVKLSALTKVPNPSVSDDHEEVPHGWVVDSSEDGMFKTLSKAALSGSSDPARFQFKRGDQVWRKGEQCTIINIDTDDSPPSCIVRINKIGRYADTELRLLLPCKFKLFDRILRKGPTGARVAHINAIDRSEIPYLVDFTVYNTGEVVKNVPVHEIETLEIPDEALGGFPRSDPGGIIGQVMYKGEPVSVEWLSPVDDTAVIQISSKGHLIYTDTSHLYMQEATEEPYRYEKDDLVYFRGEECTVVELCEYDPSFCVLEVNGTGELMNAEVRALMPISVEEDTGPIPTWSDIFQKQNMYLQNKRVKVISVDCEIEEAVIEIEGNQQVVKLEQLQLFPDSDEEVRLETDGGKQYDKESDDATPPEKTNENIEKAARFLRAIHTPKPGTIDIVIGKEDLPDLPDIIIENQKRGENISFPDSDNESIIVSHAEFVNKQRATTEKGEELKHKGDPTKQQHFSTEEEIVAHVQQLINEVIPDALEDEPRLQISPGIKEDIEASEIDTQAIISGLTHLQPTYAKQMKAKWTRDSKPVLDLFAEVLEARRNAKPFAKKSPPDSPDSSSSSKTDPNADLVTMVESMFQDVEKDEAVKRVRQFCKQLCPKEFNPLCRLVFLEMLQGCVKVVESNIPYVMEVCVDPFFQVDQDKCDELVRVCSYLLDSCKIEYENDSQQLLEKYFMHNKFPEESARQLSHLDTLHKFWKPDQAKNCHINIIRALHQLIKKYPVEVPQRGFFEKVVRIFCETYFEGDESNDWTGLLFTFVIDFMCSKRQGEEDWEELRFSAQMIDYIFTLHPSICEDEGQAKFDKIWVYQQMGQCHESLWKKTHRIQNVLKADKYYFLWCLAAINYKQDREDGEVGEALIAPHPDDGKTIKRRKYDVLWLAVMTFGHHIIESRTTSHIHRTFKQLIEKVSGRCLGLFLKCYGEYLTRNHPEHEQRGFQCMSQANELLNIKDKDEVFYSDLIFISIANNKLDYARKYLKKGRKKVTKHVKDALRSKNKRTTYLEFYRKSHRRNNLERLKRFKEKTLAVHATMVCELCGSKTVTRCGGCKAVAYCCEDHLSQDWPRHKAECKLLAQFVPG